MSALVATLVQACRGRTLFVHQSAELYGSDRVLLDIVLELTRRGGEAIVALPHDGPLVQALRAAGIETHVLGPMHVLKLTRAVLNPRGLWRLLRSIPDALRALDACVAGRRIDTVHSNTLAVLAGALWSRRRKILHLWHVHEIVERPRLAGRLFPRLVGRYADRVLCNSAATQRWLVRTNASLAGRCELLHNGVADMGAGASPETLRKTFSPLGQRLIIGLVGRINRMKGHAVLIDAAERLGRRGIRDFTLVFIGSAPPQQEHFTHALRERVAASPIGGRVVMIEFMPDLRDAYAALDIVCVPSTEAEAFGLVAVEAMAAGCAVVASRIGGLPEIVEDGQCGLLHRPGDAEDLATQLTRLIDDDALRIKLANAGRRRYEDQFRVGVMTDRFMRVLASMGEAR